MRLTMPRFVRGALALVVLLLFFGVSPVGAQNVLTTAQWREDLRYLADDIVRVHPGAFHDVSMERFRSAVAALDARIPTLSDHEVEVEFVRLIAMLREGHSRLSLPGLPDPMSDVLDITSAKDARLAFHRLPVRLYAFSDGLYVTSATREAQTLVGAKVLQIGGHSAQSALDAVQPLVNRDNEMGALLIAPQLVTVPEVLRAVGVIAHSDRVPLTLLTHENTIVNVDLAPLAPGEEPLWAGIAATSSLAVAPYRRRSNDNLWAQYLVESKTVYLKVNVLQDSGDETVAKFSRDVGSMIDSNPVDRFVIDLRGCHGGDNQKFRSLLLEFVRNAKADRLGKLFVIIDRGTFSAAVNAASDLERLTNAIFVGEPTAGAPGSWGDPRAITLPNSALIARISTIYWSDWIPNQSRRWIAPDISTPLSAADYFTGRDPAMAVIVGFPKATEFGDVLEHLLQSGAGISTIERTYYHYKTDPLWAGESTEQAMQRIGAQLVSARSYGDALLIFEINFKDYPSSLVGALQTVRAAQALHPNDAGLGELVTTLERLKAPQQSR